MAFLLNVTYQNVLFEVKTEIVRKQKRTTTSLTMQGLSYTDFLEVMASFEGKGGLYYFPADKWVFSVSLNGCAYQFDCDAHTYLLKHFTEYKFSFTTIKSK